MGRGVGCRARDWGMGGGVFADVGRGGDAPLH